MITPEKLNDYQFNYLKVHKELQESIIRDVARRIAKTDFTITETAQWQAEKLQQCGVLYDEILEQVAQELGKSRKEIEKVFEDSKTEIFNYDDELLISSGHVPQTVKYISPAMKNVISAALAKATSEVANLTMTTAVTSQAAYISACDLAHMQVISGAFSYQDAIKNAIKSAARQGVTVSYPTGHISSLDTAVRRSVLTGVNQTAGKLQEMRSNELDCDLMETTAHAGARPDHAVWQGQIVSKSGRSGYLSLSDIGYGEVTGFQGANCRHNWYMYFEGVSQRAYSPEQLREWREGTVTYNGAEMSLYDATQKQRGMERAIRKSKQELVALDELIKNTDDADAKTNYMLDFNNRSVRLKGQEAKLRDFCNKTGLDRDRYREQVFAAKTEKGLRNFGKSTSAKAVWGNRKYLTNASQGGKIDYKFTDRLLDMFEDENGVKKVYSFSSIERAMKQSEIGKDCMKYISDNGFLVTMFYHPNVDPYTMGEIKGKDITIYVANHTSIEEISCTIVHEVCHAKYNWHSTQENEINCYLMERLHLLGDLDEEDIVEVVEFVKSNYAHLPKGELYGY